MADVIANKRVKNLYQQMSVSGKNTIKIRPFMKFLLNVVVMPKSKFFGFLWEKKVLCDFIHKLALFFQTEVDVL